MLTVLVASAAVAAAVVLTRTVAAARRTAAEATRRRNALLTCRERALVNGRVYTLRQLDAMLSGYDTDTIVSFLYTPNA
jgi:hypothetical protein